MLRFGFLVLMPIAFLNPAWVHANDLNVAKAEIRPLFEAMQAAANAHDSEKHLAYYSRDPDVTFIINDRMVIGYEKLLESQRKAWDDGKSDVAYSAEGEPDFRMPADGLVVSTYFLTSQRTGPDGRPLHSRFSVTALWQRKADGWRIIYAHESKVNLPREP